jgi:signal transduction histidine kinase
MSNTRIVSIFYVACFVGIMATATLLAVLYRQVAIDSLVQIRKQDNIKIAQAALAGISRPLIAHLEAVREIKPNMISSEDFPDALRKSVIQIMTDPTVVRVKIYNARGVVIFSTVADQIGDDQSNNPGFLAACKGNIAADLLYRDHFNTFENEREEDNLMHVYLPVRVNVGSSVAGVFEIYVDVNPLVHAIERTTLNLMAGGFILLLVLYGGLVAMVHYGKRVIEAQQLTIRERTATLEMLTSQILTSHESEKRKLADDLHEGVAQTLAAIKLSVEATLRSASNASETPEHLHAAVHAIQVAIKEVREIAMDLHPPVLDDYGLFSALEWVCGEFEALCPGARAQRQLELDESEIPAPLVTIIYRIAADALKTFSLNEHTEKVSLRLAKKAGAIIFSVEETLSDQGQTTDEDAERAEFIVSKIRQHTLLSGGVFTVTGNASGGRTLRAEWLD